jgi:hypothetical protein
MLQRGLKHRELTGVILAFLKDKIKIALEKYTHPPPKKIQKSPKFN